jgi:hypothetical protein
MFNSHTIGGVGRDARRVAKGIARRSAVLDRSGAVHELPNAGRSVDQGHDGGAVGRPVAHAGRNS